MSSSRHFFAALGAIAMASAAFSQDIVIDPVPFPPVQPVGGLTLSVSTSGFQFTPIIGSHIRPLNPADLAGRRVAPDAFAIRPQGFVASVALINHTGEDIAFQFPTPADATAHFVFRIYDSKSNLIWDSGSSVTPPAGATAATLPGHQTWRATKFVPIFSHGLPLPAGTYTLAVTINGTPQFESATSFIVNNPIAVLPGPLPLVK